MADVKISELAAAADIQDSDVIVGVNNGTTKKFSMLALKNYISSTLETIYAKAVHTHDSLKKGDNTASLPQMTKNDTLVLKSDLTAQNVSYDGTASGITSKDVKTAIDEVYKVAGTEATTLKKGVMSAADKKKLDTVKENANENVIEVIKVNNVAAPVVDKTASITVPKLVSSTDGAATDSAPTQKAVNEKFTAMNTSIKSITASFSNGALIISTVKE